MRKLIVALGVLALVSSQAMAQFGFGFGRGQQQGPDALLGNKSVQEELKLTDKQKDALADLAKVVKDKGQGIREAIQDKDFEKVKEIGEEIAKETAAGLKKVRATLSKEQGKRLQEIEVQQANKNSNPDIFKREDIQTALSLTETQKKAVAKKLTSMEADIKEVQDELKGDFTQFREMAKKIAEVRKDSFTAITKTLTDDQKKTWKEMAGKEFDLKVENPFGKFKKKDQ